VAKLSDGCLDGVEGPRGEGVGGGVDVGSGDSVGWALADVVGLGDASVIVMVVTPFEAETEMSAPVAPSRKTPEMTPALAWSKSSMSFANMF